MTTKSAMSTNTPSQAANNSATNSAPANAPTASPATTTTVMHCMKSPYNADQQVKFLNLQAEIDTLLLQLQTLKQQRQEHPVAAVAERQPATVR